jgi:hypothetical protein
LVDFIQFDNSQKGNKMWSNQIETINLVKKKEMIKVFLLVVIIFTIFRMQAQNVAINGSGTVADFRH